jgi:hypothetical protein
MEATSALGGAILRSAVLLDHHCRQLRLTAETDVSELIGESPLHLKPAATPQHDGFVKLLADACCPTILVVALNKRKLTANHPKGCAGDLRLKKNRQPTALSVEPCLDIFPKSLGRVLVNLVCPLQNGYSVADCMLPAWLDSEPSQSVFCVFRFASDASVLKWGNET